jgi:hypothetical protein
MNRKLAKLMLSGVVVVAVMGVGANKAAADSFSVSVHTPAVSVGFSNTAGHHHSGYVVAPTPVVAPRPVVVERPLAVHRPVVVRDVHVCSFDRRPVTRVRYDRFGCRTYYTEWVTVRTCDDYHRRHDHHHAHTLVRQDRHHDHHNRDHGRYGRHDRDDRRYAKYERDDRRGRDHRKH